MAIEGENRRLGARGERRARAYLRKNGYRILEKNYKNPFGEVDIIAKKGEVVAFVEVKTRQTDAFGAPSEAVNKTRRQRYVRAAKYYFAGQEIVWSVRFDVIEVYRGKINHIENAYTD